MAQPNSHMSLSVIIALLYAGFGLLILNLAPEQVVLASVIIVVAGMLPNIDQTGGAAEREFGTVLAAISPLVILQFFPSLSQGGVARIALLVVACYIFTRFVIVKYMQKQTVHRGMVHSIPAAVITGQVTYLLFWDLPIPGRLYLALAAFAGFLSHLVLDASGNIDLIGKATGKGGGKAAVLKLLGPTWKSTFAIYACVGVLSWIIAQDFYPQLGIYAGVTY